MIPDLPSQFNTNWTGFLILVTGVSAALVGLLGAVLSGARARFPHLGAYAVLMLAGVGVVVGIFPNFTNFGRMVPPLTECKSRMKNVATALEMYSSDHAGAYPTSLGVLTPNYMKTIPECPAAGRDTYTGTYQRTARPAGNGFTFCCGGRYHTAAGIQVPDYPCYSSQDGLVERP
ncbi:MAG: hypothetical protein AB1758_17510 [Candidatus Eremiobacterota bacterium]